MAIEQLPQEFLEKIEKIAPYRTKSTKRKLPKTAVFIYARLTKINLNVKNNVQHRHASFHNTKGALLLTPARRPGHLFKKKKFLRCRKKMKFCHRRMRKKTRGKR